MSTGKISGFAPLNDLDGDIWLEVIQRPNVGTQYRHFRVNPVRLSSVIDTDLLNFGLITAERLPLDDSGRARLPQRPYGGLMLNLAQVHLQDGSVLDVSNVMVVSDEQYYYAQLQVSDYHELAADAVSLTVSFIGKLP